MPILYCAYSEQLPLQDFALEQQEYVEISLPNWAFSLPLSTFLAQQEVDQAGRKKAAMSDLYAERRPDFTIENALLSHPDAIPGLWERYHQIWNSRPP